MIAIITGKHHQWEDVAKKFDKEVFLASEYNGQSDCVVICFEVGQGVTPMLEEQRMEIEKIGRLNQEIISNASEVYRVWFGILERLR